MNISDKELLATNHVKRKNTAKANIHENLLATNHIKGKTQQKLTSMRTC